METRLWAYARTFHTGHVSSILSECNWKPSFKTALRAAERILHNNSDREAFWPEAVLRVTGGNPSQGYK
jgi:hypothetical protein